MEISVLVRWEGSGKGKRTQAGRGNLPIPLLQLPPLPSLLLISLLLLQDTTQVTLH